MPSSAVSAGQDEQQADQPVGRRPEQREGAPQPVEADVDGDPGHDRPGRAGGGGVPAGQPHLERDQADLDREAGDQQRLRGVPCDAARHLRERGQLQRAGPDRQQQQARPAARRR